jgi:glyoxylase-like metal-dependent hydrolase (beta-lactamase superfamily II)
MADLERALAMVGLRIENVRFVVCTHAHVDHYGQAASIIERTGCELWMHPNHAHLTAALQDPEAAAAQRMEIARSAGVPEEALRRYQEIRRETGSGISGLVEPDRPLADGVRVETDLGVWEAVETPGHAPSHVCLWQPERRLLISGDHVLGRISLYFDYGYTPDPVGEFLTSLDRVDALGARLGLSGHGRTFGDVRGHIVATRATVHERIATLDAGLRNGGPLTAFDAVARVHDEPMTEANARWWLNETLCYLRHMEVTGRAERIPGERPGAERWAIV